MKTILIAEDDNFLMMAYKAKFGNHGYTIMVAKNGEEVFDRLKEGMPDIILLDLMMPKMDGFAVLEKLKGEMKSQIPVLVASNMGQKEDIERCKQLGAVGYVIKADSSIEDLLQRVEVELNTTTH